MNYLGHWKKLQLGNKATGLYFTFTWGDEQKPHGSFLVGTSPEYEMALYTTCILARADRKCQFTLGGRHVTLTTHVFKRGNVQHVSSAYFSWK